MRIRLVEILRLCPRHLAYLPPLLTKLVETVERLSLHLLLVRQFLYLSDYLSLPAQVLLPQIVLAGN